MAELGRLLKESWSLVDEQQDRMAAYFYARLFTLDPKLRDLFPVEMDVQRSRLLGAIVTAVQTLEDPERFADYLSGLGRDHRKFSVQPEHYETVGRSLIDALRTYGADQWTLEFDQAWRDAYDVIARTMITAATAEHGPAYWYAQVLSHERRGLDTAVFTCRPLEPLPYRAGQYVSVECGYRPRAWRAYSMANAPREDQTMEFHVKAPGAGWVSGALVRRLRPGDMLRLAAPMGSMVLDRGSQRDIVCVGGGTGLAPLKAIIDDLAATNRTRWVHLFFGARTRDDLYDLAALTELAQAHPWLTVIPAVSEDPGYAGETGLVSEVLDRYGPWNDHDFYVSGSPAMVAATRRTLTRLQVPSTRVRHDVFGHDY
ncbi:globin domain-containing protein [Catellatospora sp. KI3]|uniref:globin domain-containing protein n=1 Tax=Catellatospora sp. KI3 TaxID=3041620 RepID=UPI00248248DD|nr:globin domain-containing protein [Catellatospora sp. KI3]MDI1463256.1 globin domain-containing protein [Catellatospora sp. KI3]